MLNFILLQLDTPPTDTLGFMAWVIGGLVVGMASVFGLYLKTKNEITAIYDLRIADRDKIIEDLKRQIQTLEGDKSKLLLEVKPALDSSNQVLKTIWESMNIILKEYNR